MTLTMSLTWMLFCSESRATAKRLSFFLVTAWCRTVTTFPYMFSTCSPWRGGGKELGRRGPAQNSPLHAPEAEAGEASPAQGCVHESLSHPLPQQGTQKHRKTEKKKTWLLPASRRPELTWKVSRSRRTMTPTVWGSSCTSSPHSCCPPTSTPEAVSEQSCRSRGRTLSWRQGKGGEEG